MWVNAHFSTTRRATTFEPTSKIAHGRPSKGIKRFGPKKYTPGSLGCLVGRSPESVNGTAVSTKYIIFSIFGKQTTCFFRRVITTDSYDPHGTPGTTSAPSKHFGDPYQGVNECFYPGCYIPSWKKA